MDDSKSEQPANSGRTFSAFDVAGNEFRITAFRDGPTTWYETDDGETVKRTGLGRYVVTTSAGDVSVTSDDPAAP